MTYCSTAKIPDVYLGTMIQFEAAQNFYMKNGFHHVLEQELPGDFMPNPLDKVFLRRSMWQ